MVRGSWSTNEPFQTGDGSATRRSPCSPQTRVQNTSFCRPLSVSRRWGQYCAEKHRQSIHHSRLLLSFTLVQCLGGLRCLLLLSTPHCRGGALWSVSCSRRPDTEESCFVFQQQKGLCQHVRRFLCSSTPGVRRVGPLTPFHPRAQPSPRSILCTNRDENLNRPTIDAHFHNFGPITPDGGDHNDQESGTVLSGRDAKAGGTWLGINKAGRIALL